MQKSDGLPNDGDTAPGDRADKNGDADQCKFASPHDRTQTRGQTQRTAF